MSASIERSYGTRFDGGRIMVMRTLLAFTALLALSAGAAWGDPANLDNGVFIVHAPAAFQYTSDAPAAGWCAQGQGEGSLALGRCEDQRTRVDSREPFLWYVLAAWTEPKEWCGIGFGLGTYDKSIFTFTAHGPCYPETGLELGTPNWPGPDEGVAVVTTAGPWRGNLLPVYYFIGYAYGPGTIPITVEPRTQTAGIVYCGSGEHVTYDAVALGALGLFQDGKRVCPPPLPPAVDSTAAATPTPATATESATTPTQTPAPQPDPGR
jgi:hypothetical protein